MNGRLVGINTAILTKDGGSNGIGFAVPVSIVSRVVPSLIERGSYEHSYLGVSGSTFSPICGAEMALDPALRGVLVGQAAEAGLLISVTADSVIRLVPPLILSTAEADEIVALLAPLVKTLLAE